MKNDLSLKPILVVRCPTCGAATGKKCELTTGLPRTKSHRDRRLIAADGQYRDQSRLLVASRGTA